MKPRRPSLRAVEGGEVAVLRGAERILTERRPAIFLATHGRQQDEECREILARHGYQVMHLSGQADELVARSAD